MALVRGMINIKKVYLLAGLCVSIFLMSSILNILHPEKRPLAMIWPSNQTRDTNLLIRPEVSTTLIHPRIACNKKGNEESDDGFTLLVVVCSGLTNFEQRRAIRESWGQDAHEDVKIVFLVGTQPISEKTNKTVARGIMKDVVSESEKYGDIVQEDFADSYANLTIKSLMMLKWFDQACSGKATYLMKTDDDMYVNLDNLLDLVRHNKDPYLMTGSVICGAKPIRDPYNKWYSPKYMYEGKVYPMYLSGTGYVMSGSVAGMLYQASHSVPALHLEDAYITGILRTKFNELSKAREDNPPVSLQVKDDLKFSLVKRETSNGCIFARTITSHHHDPSELGTIYRLVQQVKDSEKCKQIRNKKLRTYPLDGCWLKATKKTGSQSAAIKKMGRVKLN